MPIFDGEELRALRVAVRPKISQERMGEILGLSRETIVHIENNKASAIRGLTIETVQKWQEACEQDTDSFALKKFKSYLSKVFNIS